MILKIDRENNGDEFWTHVNEYDVIHQAPISDEARRVVTPLLTESRVESVELPDDLAAEVLAWLETLPGWDDGPEHALHPILLSE